MTPDYSSSIRYTGHRLLGDYLAMCTSERTRGTLESDWSYVGNFQRILCWCISVWFVHTLEHSAIRMHISNNNFACHDASLRKRRGEDRHKDSSGNNGEPRPAVILAV